MIDPRPSLAPLVVSTALVVLAGCSCSGTVPDAGVDAVAPTDAGLDAPSDDAAPPPDAHVERPSSAPDVMPTCGERLADPDDPTTFDTREELARAIAEARCAAEVRCNDALAIACEPVLVAPGHYEPVIDLARAAACLRAWEGVECASYGGIGTDAPFLACAGLDRAEALAGAACTSDDECAYRCEGTTAAACSGTCSGPPIPCDPPCDASHGCDGRGTCVPRAAIGEPCGAGCVVGAYCSAGVCTRDPVAGEPCIPMDVLIVHLDYCGATLACDVDGTCQVPHEVAVGARCGDAAHCGAGAYCEPSTGTCARTPLEGEPCIAHVERFTPADEASCAPGLYCAVASVHDAMGVCTPRSPAGGACDRTLACAAGLRCVPIDPNAPAGSPARCAAQVGPGCACDATTVCPYDFACIDGACVLPSVADVACTAHAECGSGGRCDEGHCHYALVGMPCFFPDHECTEGYCSVRTGTVEAGTCLPWLASHAPCARDAQCAPGESCRTIPSVGRRCEPSADYAPCAFGGSPT
ncbi:MAG: Dickkopf N-terminal cysteine-rich domain-containing protein [Sandaracinus sp.]